MGDKKSLYIDKWYGSRRRITCTYECTNTSGGKDNVRGTHEEWYLHGRAGDDGREGDCIGAHFERELFDPNRLRDIYRRTHFESFDPEGSGSDELGNGRRVAVKHARNSILCLLLSFLIACSRGPVQVELDNPDHYNEYVRLLDEKGIDYVLVDDKTLSVNVNSIDELDERMRVFEDYVDKGLTESKNDNK